MAEQPTPYEQVLMDLFAFPNLKALRAWLDGETSVNWLQATNPPYKDYEEQAQADQLQDDLPAQETLSPLPFRIE
jgi:hypothetical protein